MPSDESGSLNNDSEKFGSESGSSGTYSFCSFPLFDEESVDDDFASDIFSSSRVKSKSGQIVSKFSCLL